MPPQPGPPALPGASPQTLFMDSPHSEGRAGSGKGLPCTGSCACGLPGNTWGEGEQPADVAALRAEILISSSGYDHRTDLGSSPAQTHSSGPTPTATAPGLPHWGRVGRWGEPWEAYPQRQPRHHLPLLSQEGATSAAQPVVPGPQSSRPSVALGSRSSPPPGGARQPETQCGQWGLGSTGEHLFLKSSLSLGAAGGGAWTLTHRPLPSLGSPRPAETLHTGNNRNGREGKRARQTKAL